MSDLISRHLVNVRFSEVDSLHIVWHGHYVKYFEDGREQFGREFGLGYLDVFKEGYKTPIIDVSCQYKRPAAYGDSVIVETRFVNSPAAKIIFDFQVFNAETKHLLATGRTTQVFLDKNDELFMVLPEFFKAWKRKWGLEANE